MLRIVLFDIIQAETIKRRYQKMLLREVVWVILAHFLSRMPAFVVAVGMWATRLRCPSCPQRGSDALASWRRGTAWLFRDQASRRSCGGSPRRSYNAGSMQVRILSRRYSSLRKP